VIILILIHSPFRMWTIPAGHVDRLRRDFPHHTFLHALDDGEGERLISGADAAFSGQVTRAQLAAAGKLRWIHSPAAGVAGMLFPEMVRSAIQITNGRGMSADTIAEHVLAVILALFRRLPLAFARQAEHLWAQDEIGSWPGNRTIAGSRVLVVGLGGIGAAVSLRLHALGAVVTGIRRRTGAVAPPGVADVRSPGELPALLPSADVVVIAAPQTSATRSLLGEDELRQMKRDAVLVNVSRGGLVDEAAVAGALREGRLAGAALDVFRHEPLEPDHPMWDVPNLLITPHTSGFRRDHWDASLGLFAENLRRFERGDPLLNVVDKAAGY
jgi:phosphoglycerate dehydrogenase-like enzyme